MTERAKNKKLYTIHETDVILNRETLSQILESKDMEYKKLHERIVEEYGLDISYKGFMSLLSNKSAWKLIYAWAISDVLNIDIKTLFITKKINIEEKKKQKEAWKKKYQK